MIVWLDGELLPIETARIDPRDRGLLLGDGLFETVRLRDGEPRLWTRHLARLTDGAAVLGIPLPPGDLEPAIRELARANGLANAAVRVTLTRGAGPRGVAPPSSPTPTLLLTATHWLEPTATVRLCIARTTCRNERSPLTRLKTLNYLDAVLARREALVRGFEDAVLLNTAGRVAEATAANLFARMGGAWITPPAADGPLPGVVRAELLAAGFGREAPLTEVELLAAADELLLCNSLGVTGVSGIEDRALASGEGTRAARGLWEQL